MPERSRWAAAVAGLLLAASCVGCVAAAPDPDPVLAAHADRSPAGAVEAAGRAGTVRVRNLSCQGLGTGSGAIVGDVLVTNRHVVQGADRLEVSTVDGQRVEVEVAAVAQETDLAVLRVRGELPGGLALAPADPAPGDPVTAVGFPGGERLTFSAGEVLEAGSAAEVGEESVVVVSARVRPGNSGGPLLDAEGRLAGVVFALRTTDGAGLAIPASRLQRALSDDEAIEPVAPCTGASLLEQADQLGIGAARPPIPPQPTVPVACPSGGVRVVDASVAISDAGGSRWSISVSGRVHNQASAAVTDVTVEVEVPGAPAGTSGLSMTLPGPLAPGATEPWSIDGTVEAAERPALDSVAVRWRWADATLAARC